MRNYIMHIEIQPRRRLDRKYLAISISPIHLQLLVHFAGIAAISIELHYRSVNIAGYFDNCKSNLMIALQHVIRLYNFELSLCQMLQLIQITVYNVTTRSTPKCYPWLPTKGPWVTEERATIIPYLTRAVSYSCLSTFSIFPTQFMF